MCGIAGKIDFAAPVDATVVERMCAAMEHRGPDSLGIWCDEGVALGMRRLAIIDLVTGDQPIFNEDATSPSCSTARSTTSRSCVRR